MNLSIQNFKFSHKPQLLQWNMEIRPRHLAWRQTRAHLSVYHLLIHATLDALSIIHQDPTRISRRDTSPKFHHDSLGIPIDEEPTPRGLVCRKRRSRSPTNTIGQFSVERVSLNRYLATRAPAKHVLRNVQAREIEPGRIIAKASTQHAVR